MADATAAQDRQAKPVKIKPSKAPPPPPVTHKVWILFVALLIGTFSIFVASAFRDFADSILQLSVPLSEKAIAGGSLLVAYRFLNFLIIFSILVIVSVLLV